MVKLLLTVRRLANTWGGVYGQCGRKEAGEKEIGKEKEEGVGWGGQVYRGNYSHLLGIYSDCTRHMRSYLSERGDNHVFSVPGGKEERKNKKKGKTWVLTWDLSFRCLCKKPQTGCLQSLLCLQTGKVSSAAWWFKVMKDKLGRSTLLRGFIITSLA